MNNEKNEVEIERKYIIAMPDVDVLRGLEGFTESAIEQIYLPSDAGVTRRVRRREFSDGVRYYVTEKRRLDKMSAQEHEWEISEAEYTRLASTPAEGTRPVLKRRYTFAYMSQTFEIDVYPQWQSTAIMETELDSREREVQMPEQIKILREVTGIKDYSNAAMSRKFPDEIV